MSLTWLNSAMAVVSAFGGFSLKVVGRRRPILFSAGLFLFLTDLIDVSSVGKVQAQEPDRHANKPLPAVLQEANHADPAVRDAARDLIFTRQLTNEWTPTQTSALVEFALARQADRATAWDRYWGTLIELEMISGRDKIMPAQTERYVHQAFGTITIKARARVRRGDPLPIAFETSGNRFSGEQAGAVLLTDSTHGSVWIDDKIVPEVAGRPLRLFAEAPSQTVLRMVDLTPVIGQLPDGPHTLRIRQIFQGGGGPGATFSRQGAKEWKPMFERTEEATLKFELLPANQTSVRGKVDPAVRAMVEAFIRPCQATYKDNWDMGLSFGPHRFDAPPTMNDSKTAVCMSVFVRHGNQEWPMTSDFNWFPGQGGPEHRFPAKIIDLPVDAKTIDIVLRPNPAALINTVDAYEYLDETIVIPNVTLRRFPHEARTTSPLAGAAR